MFRGDRNQPRQPKVDPLTEAGFVVDRGANAGFKDTFPAVERVAKDTGFEFSVTGFDDD